MDCRPRVEGGDGEFPVTNLSVATRVAELGIPWTITALSGKNGFQPGTFFIHSQELATTESLQEAEVMHLQQQMALRAFKWLGQRRSRRRGRGGRGGRRNRGGRGGRGADNSGISETASDDSSDIAESGSELFSELEEEALGRKPPEPEEAPKREVRAVPRGPFTLSLGPWGRDNLRHAHEQIWGPSKFEMQEARHRRRQWAGRIGVDHQAKEMASGGGRR